MAKKRTSLKDRQVFKRSEAFVDLLSSTDTDTTEAESSPVADAPPVVPASEDAFPEFSAREAELPAVNPEPVAFSVTASPAGSPTDPPPASDAPVADSFDDFAFDDIDFAFPAAIDEETDADEFSLPVALTPQPVSNPLPTVDAPPEIDDPLETDADLDEDELFGLPSVIETDAFRADDLPAAEADFDFSSTLSPFDEAGFDMSMGLDDVPPLGGVPSSTGGSLLDDAAALADTAALDDPTAFDSFPEFEAMPLSEVEATSDALAETLDDEFGFPPATALEPEYTTTESGLEDLPMGEAGDLESDLDEGGLPPAASFPESFPPAIEPDVEQPLLEDLPSGEAGLEETPTEPAAADSLDPNADLPIGEADLADFESPSIPIEAVPFVIGPGDDIFELTREEPGIVYQPPSDLEVLTREERLELLRTDQDVARRFESLNKDIDDLYKEVRYKNVSSNRQITDWAYNLLAETRDILINHKVEYFAKAEWNIEQIKARLDRAEESENWRKHWGSLIIGWGLIWFFVFVIFFFRPESLLVWLEGGRTSSLLEPAIFLRTMFAGGIGGIASVFYSLLKYVSSRTYDKEYNLSYFVKPFMGMIVGALIYLIIYVAGRPLGITPAAILSSSEGDGRLIVFEGLSYAIALAAGFKENVAFGLLSKIMKIVFRDERKEDDLPEAIPPSGPSSSATSSSSSAPS